MRYGQSCSDATDLVSNAAPIHAMEALVGGEEIQFVLIHDHGTLCG
jgi:hypothetical protein